MDKISEYIDFEVTVREFIGMDGLEGIFAAPRMISSPEKPRRRKQTPLGLRFLTTDQAENRVMTFRAGTLNVKIAVSNDGGVSVLGADPEMTQRS